MIWSTAVGSSPSPQTRYGAGSARSTDLGAAARTAVRLGASYVSMSSGAPDGSQNATLAATYYNATGVTYVAASGDSGYAGGTMFPSTAGNVVAAGGTSAQLVSGRWQQAAWAGTDSGCSSVGLLGVPAASALPPLTPTTAAAPTSVLTTSEPMLASAVSRRRGLVCLVIDTPLACSAVVRGCANVASSDAHGASREPGEEA